jgi:dethiobiotin synthetase
VSAGVIGVTGTDTGVGKTRVACALLAAAKRHDLRAVGYKPVASGCRETAEGLRNDDAEALLAHSMPGLAYGAVNPVAFAPAIAPHLAAERAGTPIDTGVLDAGLAALRARAELVVVEGAGGWRVPLGADTDFSDWMAGHAMPVLLVVGLKLGAINHALLTAEALQRAGCWCGWVANHLPEDNTGTAEDMRATLSARLGAALLEVARDESPEQAAQRLDVGWLRQPRG